MIRRKPQERVLAPFHPSFTEWSLLIFAVVPFGMGLFRPNLILAVGQNWEVINRSNIHAVRAQSTKSGNALLYPVKKDGGDNPC
jgi:hypothetical protein